MSRGDDRRAERELVAELIGQLEQLLMRTVAESRSDRGARLILAGATAPTPTPWQGYALELRDLCRRVLEEADEETAVAFWLFLRRDGGSPRPARGRVAGVTRSRTPYEDTSVPAERSKGQIAKALRAAGAVGVQFDEEWGEETTARVRFAWPRGDDGEGTTIVRLEATTLPPDRRVSQEQRERQAWRGLAWYLESNLKAATFGLIPFEAIFLAHFETPGGRTIGEQLIPQITEGRLALPPGEASS